MSAAEALLQTLRRDGFEVSASADGGLVVRPASALTEDVRQAIREHRADLVAHLAQPPLDPDPRVTCTACRHHRPRAYGCSNHRAAGLMTSEISPALAALRQHCPGHAPLNRGTHD